MAQIAIPPNANPIDKQQSMLQRHQLKVDELHKRPDHVVCPERLEIAPRQLLGRGCPLEQGHAAEEDADEGRRE